MLARTRGVSARERRGWRGGVWCGCDCVCIDRDSSTRAGGLSAREMPASEGAVPDRTQHGGGYQRPAHKVTRGQGPFTSACRTTHAREAPRRRLQGSHGGFPPCGAPPPQAPTQAWRSAAMPSMRRGPQSMRRSAGTRHGSVRARHSRCWGLPVLRISPRGTPQLRPRYSYTRCDATKPPRWQLRARPAGHLQFFGASTSVGARGVLALPGMQCDSEQ